MFSEDIFIDSIALHLVGNKHNDELLHCSPKPLSASLEMQEILARYFLSSFKSSEYFNLYHESDLSLNEVYAYVSRIFDDPETLYEESVNLAKHLYECCQHPKIKAGEFYVVYFGACELDGEPLDAIGLFKSETKDTFLKVHSSDDGLEVESQNGVNINKLDKGALIFKKEREKGYVVAVVDNTNRGAEAQYWLDDFLHVSKRQDEYYNTQNLLSMAKSFVTEELPREFEVSRADQADLLNKSVQFFKEKDTFDMGEFASEVIAQPEVIESFNRYRDTYEQERGVEIVDDFSISDSAVKRQARVFKSVIKLDKNFSIYVHGDRSKIETGEDDKGKFYKVYYSEEN